MPDRDAHDLHPARKELSHGTYQDDRGRVRLVTVRMRFATVWPSAGAISWRWPAWAPRPPCSPIWPAVAGPFEEKDFEQLVPRDKKLDPEWVRKPDRARASRRSIEVPSSPGSACPWAGSPAASSTSAATAGSGTGTSSPRPRPPITTARSGRGRTTSTRCSRSRSSSRASRSGVKQGRQKTIVRTLDRRGLQGHHLPRRVPDRPGDLPRRGRARRGLARGLLSVHPAERGGLVAAGDDPLVPR